MFFEESRQRWVGVVDLGRSVDGKRQRQKVTGKTKAAVLKRLRDYRETSTPSLLSAAGVPLEEAMDLLGHVDTRMLERVYRHRIRPAVAAAAAPMRRCSARARWLPGEFGSPRPSAAQRTCRQKQVSGGRDPR